MKNLFRGFLVVAFIAIASAQAPAAIIIAQWSNGTLQFLPTGVASASPAPSFNHIITTDTSLTFIVTLATGYTATGVGGTASYSISGINNGQPVTVGAYTYNANTSTSQNFAATPVNIPSGGQSQFGVTIDLKNLGTVTFTDVQISGDLAAVPEPTTYALALFGLLGVGGTVGRHFLNRRQKSA